MSDVIKKEKYMKECMKKCDPSQVSNCYSYCETEYYKSITPDIPVASIGIPMKAQGRAEEGMKTMGYIFGGGLAVILLVFIFWKLYNFIICKLFKCPDDLKTQ